MTLTPYERTQWQRRVNDRERRRLDDRDNAFAQHEAGHALAARLLDIDITAATIEPYADFGGVVLFARTPDHTFNHLVVLMAGSEAERMFGSADDGHEDDLRQARALAETIDDNDVGAIIKRARRKARAILKSNFVPLTRMALALIEKRTIFAGEIEEIVESATDDDASDNDNRDAILMRALSSKLVRYGTPGEIL